MKNKSFILGNIINVKLLFTLSFLLVGLYGFSQTEGIEGAEEEKELIFGDEVIGPGDQVIGPVTNDNLLLQTNGIMRMQIRNTGPIFIPGSLGIGTYQPGAKLEVRGGSFRIRKDDGTQNYIDFSVSSNSAYRAWMTLTDDGLNIGHNSAWRPINLITANQVAMSIRPNGNIVANYNLTVNGITYLNNLAIGTDNMPSGFKLAVDGSIIAEEVVVRLKTNWPDYVFHDDYSLMSLSDVEQYIQSNGHLPEIPSAENIEKNGINIAEMNAKLLKKVEELTLYLIELNKENEEIRKMINQLSQE